MARATDEPIDELEAVIFLDVDGVLHALKPNGVCRDADPDELIARFDAELYLADDAAAKFPFPELLKRMRWGDVILFECHMAHSVAQRWVTWSPWDHVAVVVEDSDGRLQMLESCALGVRAWPLAQRLREYATHFATRIAWRQLRTPRSDHALRAMRRFVDAVDQQAVFSYNLAKMTLTPREGWFWEGTASGGKGTRLGGSSAARDVSRTTSTTRTAFSHPVYSLDLRPKTAPQRRADGRVEL
eukprot:gene3866-8546_t